MNIKEIEDAARLLVCTFGTFTWENGRRKVIVKHNEGFGFNIQHKDGETLLNEFKEANIRKVAECLIVWIKGESPNDYEGRIK